MPPQLQSISPDITIRPITLSETHLTSLIQLSAFAKMPLMDFILPHRTSHPSSYAHHVSLSHRSFHLNPHYHFFVIADRATNTPRAYALWTESHAPTSGTPPGWSKPDPLWRKIERGLNTLELSYSSLLDRWSDKAVIASLSSQLNSALREWGPPYLYLKHLCVLPEWQGKGYGGLLVRHGIEAARSLRAGAALLSTSVVGDRVYEREGFRTVRVVSLAGGLRSNVMVWDWDGDDVKREPSQTLHLLCSNA